MPTEKETLKNLASEARAVRRKVTLLEKQMEALREAWSAHSEHWTPPPPK